MKHITLAQHIIPQMKKDTAIVIKREAVRDLQSYEFAYRTTAGTFEFRNVHGAGKLFKHSPYGEVGDTLWLKENRNMVEDDARIFFEIRDIDVGRKHVGVANDNPWAWILKLRVA